MCRAEAACAHSGARRSGLVRERVEAGAGKVLARGMGLAVVADHGGLARGWDKDRRHGPEVDKDAAWDMGMGTDAAPVVGGDEAVVAEWVEEGRRRDYNRQFSQ